ncbi:hypothetical protein [Clostridium sp.]|uniref:hypothetical protein n=1 Tax=Clostridium sp. TaxID=1506 RepID=UPI002FC95731
MDSNITYEDLPEGYIEKRRNSTIVTIGLWYIFCLFLLLKEFEIISVHKGSFLYLLQYGILLTLIFSTLHSETVKRFYNNIPMMNCNEIKVFSKKQSLLMILPLLIIMPFIIVTFVRYAIFIGGTYVAINVFNKPGSMENKHMRSKW